MIVDAQVHIWPAETPERPRHAGRGGEAADVPISFSSEDLLRAMDVAGIDRAILVPPGWDLDRADYVLAAARAFPDRFAVVGRFALDRPRGADRLQGWLDQPGMLGLRIACQHEQDRHVLLDGSADWFWPEAERLGIPVMVYAPFWLTELNNVAARFPRLKIVIDHMGLYRQQDDAAVAAMRETAKLAVHPNLSVKLSAAPLFSSEPFPWRNLHAGIGALIAAFGPNRCFWGSDLTRLMGKCTYAECARMFSDEAFLLSPPDRDRIMGNSLLRYLGWA